MQPQVTKERLAIAAFVLEMAAIVKQRKAKKQKKLKGPARGVYNRHMIKLLERYGWTYTPFDCGELPTFDDFAPPLDKDGNSRCIIFTKRHYFACINGRREDTHNKARHGLVIGYFAALDCTA